MKSMQRPCATATLRLKARRDAKEIAQIKFENLCAPLRAAGLEASKTGDRYTVSNLTGDQLARVAELFREGGND